MDSLSQEAGQQRSLLRSKQVEAERALQGITVAMESAGSHRQEVSVLQKQLALDQVGLEELQLPLPCTSKTGLMPGLRHLAPSLSGTPKHCLPVPVVFTCSIQDVGMADSHIHQGSSSSGPHSAARVEPHSDRASAVEEEQEVKCDDWLQGTINTRKAGVETELSTVAPMIEEARQAVGQIRAEHLSEIRSLKAPPDAIRDVLEGVLRLMGQADTSWNSMKKFLGNRGVKVRQT